MSPEGGSTPMTSAPISASIIVAQGDRYRHFDYFDSGQRSSTNIDYRVWLAHASTTTNLQSRTGRRSSPPPSPTALACERSSTSPPP